MSKSIKDAYLTFCEFFKVSAYTQGDYSNLIVMDKTLRPSSCFVISVDMTNQENVKAFTVFIDNHKTGEINNIIDDYNSGKVAPGVIPMTVKEAAENFGLNGNPGKIAKRSALRFVGSLPKEMRTKDLLQKVEALEYARQTSFPAMNLSSIINKDALDALDACDDANWRSYAFFAETGEKGIRRRQAAGVYPYFATLMATRISLKSAIDNGNPLNEKLVGIIGEDEAGKPKLSNAILKRLQGRKSPLYGMSIVSLVDHLSKIPPDWIPSDDKSWDAMIKVFAAYGDELIRPMKLDYSEFLKSCAGKWHEFLARLSLSSIDTRPPEGTSEEMEREILSIVSQNKKTLGDYTENPEKLRALLKELLQKINFDTTIDLQSAINWICDTTIPNLDFQYHRNTALDVADMVESFCMQIALPTAAYSSYTTRIFLSPAILQAAREFSSEALFSGKSGPAILEASRGWHNRRAEIDELIMSQDLLKRKAAMESITEEDAWPPLCNSWMASNGIWLVPRFTPSQLADEGRSGVNEDGTAGLSHCVGSYTRACRVNGHHIISIVSKNPESPNVPFVRLATAELEKIDFENPKIKTKQIRGYSNREPPPQAQEAFNEFKAGVESGIIPLNAQAIMAFYDGVRTGGFDDIERHCLYDWKEKAAIKNAMNCWGAFVSKPYRRHFDEFSNFPAMNIIKRLINPSFKPKTEVQSSHKPSPIKGP